MLYMGYALNQGIPSLCAVKTEAGVVFARILYQDGVFRRMSDGDRRSLAKTDRKGKVQTVTEKAKHNACAKQRIVGSHPVETGGRKKRCIGIPDIPEPDNES